MLEVAQPLRWQSATYVRPSRLLDYIVHEIHTVQFEAMIRLIALLLFFLCLGC